ncbi:MAG: hypothetical protein ABI678_31075, partial [Kofleriaceae bacterium]
MKLLVVMALAACGSPQGLQTATPAPPEPHTQLATDDDPKPTYDKAALEKALIAERGAEATNERRVADAEQKGDGDGLRIAVADLAVRRRFIATLETCQQNQRLCPPRLDDPPAALDAPLRFDLASWQKLTTELHGRACACRTQACLDATDDQLNELEQRPMQDVRG